MINFLLPNELIDLPSICEFCNELRLKLIKIPIIIPIYLQQQKMTNRFQYRSGGNLDNEQAERAFTTEHACTFVMVVNNLLLLIEIMDDKRSARLFMPPPQPFVHCNVHDENTE